MVSIDNFTNPASISFNITEIVDENAKEYTIQVPATGSEPVEFDKAVLVFRMDMTEVGAIFMTIKNPKYPLLVRNVDNNYGLEVVGVAHFSMCSHAPN